LQAIAGPEYFGLNHPDIVHEIENLENSSLCVKYWEGRAVREVQREQCAKGKEYGRKKKTWSWKCDRDDAKRAVAQTAGSSSDGDTKRRKVASEA